MAAKKTEEKVITITKPMFRNQVYKIRGTAPLHCNQMSEEAKQAILNNATGDKPLVKPAKKTAEEQFQDSIYRLPENSPWRAKGYEYGFPGRGLKKSLVEAARLTDRKMVAISQLIRVKADVVPICKGEPVFHAEIIHPDTGNCCASIRAAFDEWEMLVPVSFLEGGKGLSTDEVASLFALAGETVGLGCGRTIKDGTNGTFEVAAIQEGK